MKTKVQEEEERARAKKSGSWKRPTKKKKKRISEFDGRVEIRIQHKFSRFPFIHFDMEETKRKITIYSFVKYSNGMIRVPRRWRLNINFYSCAMWNQKKRAKKKIGDWEKNVRIDFIVCFMSADAIFIVKCNRNRNIPREGKKRETLVHSLNFYLFIYRIK